jgi:hypothetical protein
MRTKKDTTPKKPRKDAPAPPTERAVRTLEVSYQQLFVPKPSRRWVSEDSPYSLEQPWAGGTPESFATYGTPHANA